jgi:PAS domain S-box-containing protein
MLSKLTPDVISILEHIPNAFYALDQDFRFLHANNRIQQLLGKTEPELIGMNIWEIFPSWKELAFGSVLTAAMASNEPARLEEFSPSHQKWFELNIYASPFGLAVYVTDVTARKEAESRLITLNHASEILATEHDLRSALDKVARIIVPKFSDWFLVHHMQGGIAEILHMHHQDEQQVKWAREYRERNKFEMNTCRPGTVPWVIRIGKAVLSNEGSEAAVAAIAMNEEHQKLLQQVAIKARIVVPMVVRGKIIGALSFTSSSPGRTYDDADLRFAGDLAVLIGMSIENSRMFDEMRRELAHKIRKHKEQSLTLSE